MTIDEKWAALDMYCTGRLCADCKLKGTNCEIGDACPSQIKERINYIYKIVFDEVADASESAGQSLTEAAEALEKYATIPLRDAAEQSENVQRHENICRELNALYAHKNADYGDSFHKTFLEEGMAMARIRLSDKLERFKRLTKSNEQHVHDESVRDTLIDLANYAILTVMELDGGGSGEG